MKQLVITNQITKRESDSFKKYLKEISEIEPFASPKDEHECAVKAWNGDKKAKEELIRRNLRFVVSCAKQYQVNGIKLEDLVNEGNIGITAAADRFNPTMGFKFISYAVWYIRKDIVSFLSSNSRIIRLPNNKIDAVAKYKSNMSKLEQILERPVDVSDMLTAYEDLYSKEDLELLNELTNNSVSSLDMSVGNDEGGTTLSELICDTNLGGADELVIKSDLEVNINALTSVLSSKEKTILTMLYGLDGQAPCTLADVGDVFSISRESVRQKRDAAFRKIQTRFKTSLKHLLYE